MAALAFYSKILGDLHTPVKTKVSTLSCILKGRVLRLAYLRPLAPKSHHCGTFAILNFDGASGIVSVKHDLL